MSSSSGKCPVCEIEISGDTAEFQQHVNKHLDENEEEESRKIAESLHYGNKKGNSSETPKPASVGVLLGPTERMIQEQEDGDAALASAIAAADGLHARNANIVAPSLRGSLSDSAEHFYPNILSKIFPPYDTMDGMLRKKLHICSKLDLFSSNVAGLGWDCGFRNIQMLFSALIYHPELKYVLRCAGISEVPSVPEIAGRIEDAWKKGFDPEGAATFGGSLLDKEVWIGATEVYVLLRSIGCAAFVKDFETPTITEKRAMFEYIFTHFEQWCNGRNCSLHNRGLLGTRKPCLVPPIFFQWQGHSITIVGVDKARGGEVVLIVLDPSRGFYVSLLEHRTPRAHLVRRTVDHPQFAQPRFQMVSLPPPKSEGSAQLRDGKRRVFNRIRRSGPS